MSLYGFAGNILYVDLTSGKIEKKPIDGELAKNYIGGMGINSKLVYDMIKPGIDPLSPKNVLVFGAGPFVGTIVPGSARCELTAKSPLTGLLGMTNAGDSIGTVMKFAGYDHMVFTGKAKSPVYVKVIDDDIEICDASELWGKDAWETTDILWDKLGECWVTCIGPGGETMVRYAAPISNKHSVHARTGMGAVMGSKNLKAIVTRGTKSVRVAESRKLLKLVDPLLERMRTSPVTDMWRKYGFVVAFDGYAATGLFLKRNFGTGFRELPQVFSQEEYRNRIVKKNYACQACPIGCKQLVEIKDGKYAGLNFRVAALGSQVAWHSAAAVDSWDEVVKCVEQQNRLGLDSSSLCGNIGFAIELYQRGLITKKDTDGLELNWGAETVKILSEKIARREGIGNILAEDLLTVVDKFGPETAKYAMHVKGLNLALGMRGRLSTENFGQLTNPRGGHLDRSASLTFIPRKPEAIRKYCPSIGIPEDRLDAVCEGPEGFNVARLTKWVEDYNSAVFSTGICHRTPITQHLSLRNITELYKAATGIEVSVDEFREAGERIWNIQRAFNAREGATRKDDLPPMRTLSEPIVIGEKEFPPLNIESINKLLDEYYQERGWDKETGVPTKRKLASLGLGA